MLKKNKMFLGGIFFIIVTLACSFLNSPKSSVPALPNYGVFLVNGDEFVELKQYDGKPSKNSIRSELETAPKSPIFWVWYPQIDQQYFILVNLERTGTNLSYTTTPKDNENQILEIKPINSLNDGTYCFIQGDPLGSPFSLPYWCFNVGDVSDNNISLVPTATIIASPTENTQGPTPQILFDSEAENFREKSLEVLDGITSLDYTLRGQLVEKGPFSGSVQGMPKKFKINIIYTDGYIEEAIQVDKELCFRNSNESWQCTPVEYYFDPISEIKSIISGQIPTNTFQGFTIVEYSSKLDQFEGIDCQMFLVRGSYTSSQNVVAEAEFKVCVETKSFYPIYKAETNQDNSTGTFVTTYEEENFNFRFNIPVEIVLPQ